MENVYKLPDYLVFSFGYLMLPVKIGQIINEIELLGDKFYAKDSFHTSIMSVRKYARKLAEKEEISELEAEKNIVGETIKYLKSHKLNFRYFLDDIRVCQEDDKRTIIVLCEVNGLNNLFEHLKKVFLMEIPTQPTHVTFYTLENRKPIGIVSLEELDLFAVPLKGSALKKVKEAIYFESLPKRKF